MPRWPANLNGAMDYQVLKGKIQWFNGAWTDWFVPGYNDVDYKFNMAALQSCSVPGRPVRSKLDETNVVLLLRPHPPVILCQ
eukprot:Em0017g303a